jgi:hypothetical protein
MANSGFETSDEKLHIFGVSRADDDTAQYSYWITISTSLPSINVTKYSYLVASYVTKSQNTTIRIGVVIDGKVFYPIDSSSSKPTISVVNLKQYATSGNLTEIFVRSRVLGGNMTVNFYLDYILIASKVE